MSETVHEIRCTNCESTLSSKQVLYLELITPDAWTTLSSLGRPRCTSTICPECGYANTTDLPFSVYDPRLNRLYHYMPANSFEGMDLAELFDFVGDATHKLVGAVIGHLQGMGALSSGVLEYQIQQRSFSFRTFFSASELVLQVFAGAQVFAAHQEKAERRKHIEPPADFLKRGSRMYKRNKLKFIYGLGQGFQEGRIYTESEVDRVIQHERKYSRENEIDGSHARVALVELGILERTSCGRSYWRKPAASRIHGLNFPSRVEGFEKCGYIFFDEPHLGFSVNYQSQALESRVSFYLYGAPDLRMSAQTIETEFSTSKDSILEHFQREGQNVEVLDDKRLTLDDLNGRAETVCHLTLRITDPDSTAHRSHFLLTSWGGRFIKVRMTSAEAVVNDDEVLSRFVAALLKKLANDAASTLASAPPGEVVSSSGS